MVTPARLALDEFLAVDRHLWSELANSGRRSARLRRVPLVGSLLMRAYGLWRSPHFARLGVRHGVWRRLAVDAGAPCQTVPCSACGKPITFIRGQQRAPCRSCGQDHRVEPEPE